MDGHPDGLERTRLILAGQRALREPFDVAWGRALAARPQLERPPHTT